MPYDAGVAAAVCRELNERIADTGGKGGRIEKILQPAREQIILQVYAKGSRLNLCLDADANSPKVYITDQTAENPPSMSSFYSILRKYIMNAKINSVSVAGFDRIFEFKLDAADEMGFAKTRYLYVECIRKQSNIILCGEEKKIISALKPVDFSMSEIRQVLPGFMYEPPAPSANPPLGFPGLSPLIAREMEHRAAESGTSIEYQLEKLAGIIKNNDFAPTILADENGDLVDFSYINIKQYGGKTVSKRFGSMSGAVDFYFAKKDHDNRIKQRSNDILKILSNARSRLQKKIRILERELKECETKEKFKIYGDLITANIYRLEKGKNSGKYEVEDYYDENDPGKITEINVDKNLNPAQNAQRFYKKYNKLKSAEYHLAKQIDLANDDMIYVESVFESLTRILSERELGEIRAELTESGMMKSLKPGKMTKSSKKPQKQSKQSKQLPVSKPEEYKSINGFKILCGRNNKQNDELTFKTAAKNDLWFHAQKIPGSHVILVCESTGRKPEDKDIEDAAKIAAAYSKGKNMPLVPVDYAYARYVKKPGGAKPGFVTYSNFKTAIVKPEKIIDK